MRVVRIAWVYTAAAWITFGASVASRADAVKSWSAVPSGERYEVLASFNDQAFLDKDTGLVWDRFINGEQEVSPTTAAQYCLQHFVAGKGGWRLPKFEEIHSLLEDSGSGIVTAAPFTNYTCDNFYYFGGGWINTCAGTFTAPSTENDIMCVRGGAN